MGIENYVWVMKMLHSWQIGVHNRYMYCPPFCWELYPSTVFVFHYLRLSCHLTQSQKYYCYKVTLKRDFVNKRINRKPFLVTE